MRLPSPSLLALPLRLIPAGVHDRAAALALQQVFRQALTDGDLDFMEGRTLAVRVRDLPAGFRIHLGAGRILPGGGRPDLEVTGGLGDYLALLSGREDPDTLFFQRRLTMSGDTALGVELKNFLAAIEPESLPFGPTLMPLSGRFLDLWRRIEGTPGH